MKNWPVRGFDDHHGNESKPGCASAGRDDASSTAFRLQGGTDQQGAAENQKFTQYDGSRAEKAGKASWEHSDGVSNPSQAWAITEQSLPRDLWTQSRGQRGSE